MTDKRESRAKKNIVVSLGCQITTLICGLIVPGLLLGEYGSEVYGATSSITQFLAYITLLEGGIGGVARAALYKPLADNDQEKISAVMAEIRSFFRIIVGVFAAYVLVLACTFKSLSHLEQLDWISTFLLVIVISLSTFAQYYIGVTHSILLQAAQKSYITNLINILGTVANTVAIVVLVKLRCSIITVKLISSCIFILKPVALWLYARKIYTPTHIKSQEKILTQKWSGLGQHIAFFLHSNTDIAVLTCFANLQAVSVYAVYNMVVAHIQSLSVSFISGMEALFGDMLARKEYDQLHKTFGYYETIISIISVILFATAAVLIVPFVKIYTYGITDANYYAPVFSLLLIFSAVLYCLRMPYHSVVIAAGHFKQTSVAAYSEAIMNIGLSVILVDRFGLPGVAVGTMAATGFRFIYYVIYLTKNIFDRKIGLFLKRMVVNIAAFSATMAIGYTIVGRMEIINYSIWVVSGCLVFASSCATVTGVYMLFYRNDCLALFRKLMKKH